MDEIQQWLEVLHAADAKYQEDPNDSQAADDSQYAAYKILILRNGASEKSNTPETTGNDISQKIAQPISGAVTAALLGAGKGIGYLQDKRDLSQARAFVRAQQELAAKTPQTGLERQIQGTIDPATGETGRARQTGYNEMTHEQKLARTQVTNPTIKSLIQQGIITGQNPLLGATGHIGSTETGVLAKPEEIAAYKASKATPQVKPPSLMGNVVGSVANTAGKVLNTVSPYAAAYGLGSQAFDAAERGWQGDYPGAAISALGAGSNFYGVPGIAIGLALEKANRMRDEFARGERQLPNYENVNPAGDIGYAEGGVVTLAEGSQPPQLSGGLPHIEELLRAIKNPEKTPVVPVPNRWFSQPDKFPQVQGLVEKALTHSGQPREAFHSGAFIDPRTGEVLDRRIYNNLGVVIDPQTGKPMMSVGNQAGIEVLDPKTGSYTKSNLVRKNLFTPTGGDPLLNRLPFIATIENKGVHHYGLGTQYATPTELYNTMKGENPTLRPRSRGEVFGMGDVVGQARIGGRDEPKNIYEKLFVAPKGSDVPGVRLGTTGGGGGGYINPINPLMGSGLTPFGMKTGGKVKK